MPHQGGGGSSSGTGGGGGGSPEAWSTNSDSPTPTNSVAERPWAKDTLWHGLLGDEHRQLLGTEEESSDRHSSDDDENESELVTLYQITQEQREYYYKQFKAVQRDPNGLLSGQAARLFFEKSRIPVEELRHIWQLCDVTRDGALSLSEFTAAMHLVVLRRNNIPLPTVLPACLHPSVLQQSNVLHMPQEPPEADLLHLNDDEEDENTDNTIIASSNSNSNNTAQKVHSEKNIMNLSAISTSSQASNHSRQHVSPPPPLPPPVKQRSISISPNNDIKTTQSPPILTSAIVGTSTVIGAATASTSTITGTKPKEQPQQLWSAETAPATQWTKFSESPTTTATNATVSSPGLKPVLFDIKRTAQEVVSNPQILHPVPLRVTPVGGSVAATSNNTTEATLQQQNYQSSTAGNDDNVVQQETSPKGNQQQQQQQQQAQPPPPPPQQYQQQSHHRDSLQNNDLRAIQRPQAKKLPAKNIGALPPPPQREPSIGSNNVNDGLPITTATATILAELPITQSAYVPLTIAKKEPPPLPPPRPHRHTRSSSLDLNKFKMSAPGGQQPEITAQASFDLQTSTGFADFTQFPDDNSVAAAAVNVCESSTIATEQLHSLPPAQALPPPPTLTQQQQAQQPQQQQATTTTTATNAAGGALPPTRISLQSNQRVSAFEVYRKPNTPRSSQSPQPQLQPQQTTTVPQTLPLTTQSLILASTTSTAVTAGNTSSQQQSMQSATSVVPFGAIGAAALMQQPLQLPLPCTAGANSIIAALPNADLFEKRVTAISESLRHVSFKQNEHSMPDVLRRLREQNSLLLRLCNDLSDELLTVQTRKEELRIKLESLPPLAIATGAGDAIQMNAHTARTVSSISAPVTANVTGGSAGSAHSNV